MQDRSGSQSLEELRKLSDLASSCLQTRMQTPRKQVLRFVLVEASHKHMSMHPEISRPKISRGTLGGESRNLHD